jgi:hypothetical protein
LLNPFYYLSPDLALAMTVLNLVRGTTHSYYIFSESVEFASDKLKYDVFEIEVIVRG